MPCKMSKQGKTDTEANFQIMVYGLSYNFKNVSFSSSRCYKHLNFPSRPPLFMLQTLGPDGVTCIRHRNRRSASEITWARLPQASSVSDQETRKAPPLPASCSIWYGKNVFIPKIK